MTNEKDDSPAGTALGTLRRALKDPAVEVRREAAFALGQLGDAASADPLLHALTSDLEPVRRAAALALGRISTVDAKRALLEALRHDIAVWRETAVALSKEHDPHVLEELAKLLADGEADEHARRGAALALGALLAGEPLSMESAINPTFEDEQGRLHVMF